MCLLFSHMNNEAAEDEYKLVVVDNRDEYWKRPTKIADYWAHNNTCLSGLDEEPGREGGTWLGMNVNGRIGVLLNILGELDPTKKGRGSLVSEYITTSEEPISYLDRLSHDKTSYCGFHLVLFDYRNGKFEMNYLTNCGSETEKPETKECFGVSNSQLSEPWQKVIHGKPVFQSIVNQYPSTRDKDELVDSLFTFMLDKKLYHPDPVLIRMGKAACYPEVLLKQQSANLVWSPSVQYGTRTTTIILVDGKGECNYIEKTLTSPVNVEKPEYTVKSFTFNLT